MNRLTLPPFKATILLWFAIKKLCLPMFEQPKMPQRSRADNYRDLAKQARDMVVLYDSQAERFERQGDAPIAAEYRQLAAEAKARAARYAVLADSSE